MVLRTGIPTAGAIGLAMMGGGTAATGAVATYRDKVLGYGPIAYWMQAEAAGLVAIDEVNSPLQDGTYIGVTLGQPGIGDGNTCPLFDGINDVNDVYSVTLRGAFDGGEGTMLVWAKVFNVGVWTDGGGPRYSMNLAVDIGANRVFIVKGTSNITWMYEAGNVPKAVTVAGLSDIDWMCLALTWSATADEMKAFKDGAQVGATQNGLGVWAGVLNSFRCCIGDRAKTHVDQWHGYLAHGIVWDTALTPADILDLATI